MSLPSLQPAFLPRVDIGLDLAVDLEHRGLHSGDDLRMETRDIVPLARVRLEVIKLKPNKHGGSYQLEIARSHGRAFGTNDLGTIPISRELELSISKHHSRSSPRLVVVPDERSGPIHFTAVEGGRKARSVELNAIGKGDPGELAQGRQQIDSRDRDSRHPSRIGVPRPPNDEGDPDSALPELELAPAEP